MGVEIKEAFDRAHEFPKFVLDYDGVSWKDPRAWRFEVALCTRFGKTIYRYWAIRLEAGADYAAIREALRKRAAARNVREVTVYHFQRPPSTADLAFIEQVNRDVQRERARGRWIF